MALRTTFKKAHESKTWKYISRTLLGIAVLGFTSTYLQNRWYHTAVDRYKQMENGWELAKERYEAMSLQERVDSYESLEYIEACYKGGNLILQIFDGRDGKLDGVIHLYPHEILDTDELTEDMNMFYKNYLDHIKKFKPKQKLI